MWALRRASNPLKNQAFSLGSFRAGCARLEIASCYLEDDAESVEHTRVTFDNFLSLKRYHHRQCDSLESFIGRRHFSSEAGMKSNGEEDEDSKDEFSELETSASADATQASNVAHENDDELISEHELSEEDNDDDDVAGLQNELELSDTETDVSKKRFSPRRDSLQLLKVIMASPGFSVRSALEKWVEVGNDVNKTQILTVAMDLRRRRMYWRALQLFEWLESSKRLDFSEREYATFLDLIAKVQGLQKAESYIKLIPKSYRGERIYRTYLANCVVYLNVRKAEEVFNKMKDLQFTVTAFACNQLLLLYKRLHIKKIADVLLLMEKENVKPTIFIYNTLIDAKGESNDMIGMDQIVETMKAEGIEPSIHTQSLLAKHYLSGGLTEKAEVVMKEMEGGDLKKNRAVCRPLLLLYASLGKADDVSRIWKVCQSDPSPGECLAAIEAWGKLNKVEEAEAVFEKLLKRWKKPSSKTYSTLLKVYANHMMLAKGKELVKRMSDSGCRIGPLTWDALVKLYVEAGEVEKADSILQKAVQQQNRMKPLFNSYITIMDQYSKRGDVHNAEKMFRRTRELGYVSRLRQFQCLVQTYINANSPCYGMRERMKADNIFPSKSLAGMLVQVDPFKKTSVSKLLD